MKKIAAIAAVVLLVVGLDAVIGAAPSEAQTPVRVALTDMSASAGMGPRGQWMMGPGYGSSMQGMMANGMMRPGYGWGPGMMGQGYGSGSGMMGPNMIMGMMAIRIDRDSVKAGSVKFDVTNWSRVMPHEMLIVAVDDPSAPLPYDSTQARVKENQIKVLGDTSEMQPSASHTVDLTLAPGWYLLICNVAGHYASGMATPLQVTP